MASAELFPEHAKVSAMDTFRGVITGISSEFKDLMKWLVTAKRPADVALIGDGRSDVARIQIREILKELVGGDGFTELWIVYDMEKSLHTDVRNPKRKIAWSCANMEVVFALLDQSRRNHLGIVNRDTFTKSGEVSNFSRSFTGVPFRNLAEIPRLVESAKAAILGQAAVGACSEKKRVQQELESKGHPLFWGEWKPVQLYSLFYREFNKLEVVDFCVGSGAAAIAARYSGIAYRGFAHNDAHCKWVTNLFERIFAALVLKKVVPADIELVKGVETYLKRTADAAAHMLPKEKGAFGDAFTGDDDSCQEDE